MALSSFLYHCLFLVFKHFCGSEEDHIADTRPEAVEDPEAALEMEEMDVTMETEPNTETESTNQASAATSAWKKKKKKKKNNRKF